MEYFLQTSQMNLISYQKYCCNELNDHHQYWIEDYDKFYVTWATNSLPEEFNFEDEYNKIMLFQNNNKVKEPVINDNIIAAITSSIGLASG